jgi:hypothetical protein
MCEKFAGWRKSSASSLNDGCLEVASCLSTYSAANRQCTPVEVQHLVGVRDTKLADSPVLEFGTEAWHAFTSGIKARELRGSGSR